MKKKLSKRFLGLVFSSLWALLTFNSVSAQTSPKAYRLINLFGATEEVSTTLGIENGKTITKTSENGSKNNGGICSATLKKGDHLQFKVNAYKSYLIGLLPSNLDYDYNSQSMQYRLYLRAQQFGLEQLVYEDNILKGYIQQTSLTWSNFILPNTPPVFSIKFMQDNTIEYFRNSTRIWKSPSVGSIEEFTIAFNLIQKDSQIIDLQIFKSTDVVDEVVGDTPTICSNYNYINDNTSGLKSPTNAITSIQKISTLYAWNAGTIDSNVLLLEGSYLTYKVKKGQGVFVGLRPSTQLPADSNNGYSYRGETIHGIFTHSDNFIYIQENKENPIIERKITRFDELVGLDESSEFKIMYKNGRVKYFYNNKLIYVSKRLYIITDTLRLDFSLNSVGAEIRDLKICNPCTPNTVTPASSTPTVCVNSVLTEITHATAAATGIATSNNNYGLPAGVSATWANNIITISGSPSEDGTFNYSIPLSEGCGPQISAIGTITVNPTILPTFEQVGIIGNGAITYQLPNTSSNGISGTWNPSTLAEGEQEYTFTPNAGQCSNPITMSFMVLKPKTILAFDDDFSDTAISGTTGGITPSVFTNDEINFTDATTSANTTIAMLNATPTAALTINPDGTITIPSGTPAGTYSIDYQITSIACPLNNDTATATVVVTTAGTASAARKEKPKTTQSQGTEKITVYPNPSTAIFTIDLTGTKVEYNTIIIYNLLGQPIYEGNLIPKTSNPVDVSKAPSGYYMARVSSHTQSTTFNLIKK